MNLQYRSLVLPALLAAAALALTGCSQDTAKNPKSDLPQGPISQRMAALEDRFDGDVSSAMMTSLEESVAACMKDQGFDYTPQTMDSDSMAQYEDMPEWGSEEFAKTYGYGVTTWQDMPGSQVTETDSPDESSPLEADEAYWEALYGTQPDVPVAEDGTDEDSTDAGGAEAWLPGGCYGEALEQIGMAELVSSPVAQEIENLSAQVEEDDAVVAALDGWSSCMADEDYKFETSEDAQNSFYDRLYTEDGEPLAGDELKALKDEEIATAVADYQCGTDVDLVRATVLAQLETDYYTDHKTEVDAYFAQAEKFFARG